MTGSLQFCVEADGEKLIWCGGVWGGQFNESVGHSLPSLAHTKLSCDQCSNVHEMFKQLIATMPLQLIRPCLPSSLWGVKDIRPCQPHMCGWQTFCRSTRTCTLALACSPSKLKHKWAFKIPITTTLSTYFNQATSKYITFPFFFRSGVRTIRAQAQGSGKNPSASLEP